MGSADHVNSARAMVAKARPVKLAIAIPAVR
jgi:hypothetical protein